LSLYQSQLPYSRWVRDCCSACVAESANPLLTLTPACLGEEGGRKPLPLFFTLTWVRLKSAILTFPHLLRNKNPTGYPFPLCSTLHTIPNCFYRHFQRSFHPERVFEALLQKTLPTAHETNPTVSPSTAPPSPTQANTSQAPTGHPTRQHPAAGQVGLAEYGLLCAHAQGLALVRPARNGSLQVPPARRGNLKEGGNCRLCPRDWYYSSPISSAGSPFVLSCSLSWGAVCVR
jgi:hypothetical protein